MTLREEILEATKVDGGMNYSSEDKESVDAALNAIIKYFNFIGRADAANILRNLKNKHVGIKTRYMNKMADMVKQYKDF